MFLVFLALQSPNPNPPTFSTTMALQLRARHRVLTNPHLIQRFSTSNSPDQSDPPTDPTEPKPQSDSHPLFGDIRASLKQNPRTPASYLSQFQRRTPAPAQQPNHISFSELYNKNVAATGPIDFGKVQDSLKTVKPNSNPNEPNARTGGDRFSLPLWKFKDVLSQNEGMADSTRPSSPIFDREINERKREAATSSSGILETEFVKIYSYNELGEKLRKLRPEGSFSFTLGELSQRLIKLREMETEECGNHLHGDIRSAVVHLQKSEVKSKKHTIQRISILADIGETPDYMKEPPKEELVEKYFHPDNMSSADKLKVELSEVRDEFKMSESDCGSARVQVAQLTTKIKHLSSVLHKKDKHSIKGLQAMVQRRKKLLKYLRRTDWDSYCLVLSKLGLRDTPDYKQEYKKHYKT